MSETLEIRAKPRPVRRFSKKVLMIGVGGLALLLSTALAYALQAPKIDTGNNTELYNTTHKPVAEALERLPKTYADVSPYSEPKLGPPLPGDLGAAYLGTGETAVDRTPNNPFKFRPLGEPKPVMNARQPTRLYQQPRQDQPDPSEVFQKEIRNSALFFDVGSSKTVQAANTIKGQSAFGIANTYDPLSEMQAMMGIANMNVPNIAGMHNQTTNGALSQQAGFSDIYNKGQLQSPKSPYQVMAGTLISASLVTGLNSDLPGQVIGQVTENVYDTVSGKHLLIPQGAKLIGSYENRNSYGDTRAFVSWSRLIFPNGNSITLDDLGAIDGQGFAGLKDKVNNHYGKLAGATILSSVLGVGAELATDQDDRYVRAIQMSGQDSINMAGHRVIDRSLNVQPTITIRPGWRFNVLVSRDLILKPYQH